MPKSGTDTHHICWPRAKWNRGKWAKKIRDHPYFHIEVPTETVHKKIHAEIPEIPVPNEFTAKDVYLQVTDLISRGALRYSDPPVQRLDLLITLFDYEAQPTTDALKKQRNILRRHKNPP